MVKNTLSKPEKTAIATLALFGLTEALLDPPGDKIFLEAYRIIFDVTSDEMKQLAALLEVDPTELQNQIFAHLERAGFPCASPVKH